MQPLGPVFRRGEHFVRGTLDEMKARFELDASGMVAGVRARLESRLPLTPLQVPGDLADAQGLARFGRIRTQAFSAPRLRKVVLSEIALWPMIEGFSLTLLPEPGIDAPCFGSDLLLLPTRLSANADVYGPPSWTRGLLSTLGPSCTHLGSTTGPSWAASIASGEGLHVKVSPRLLDEVFAALTGALGLFLDSVVAAPSRGAPEPDDAGHTSQQAFFRTFHSHGPRRGPLRFVFGDNWAERYSRLVFE